MIRRPKFELFMGEDYQYYFRLRAGNGEILCVSEAYVSAGNARRGIKALRRATLWPAKIVDRIRRVP